MLGVHFYDFDTVDPFDMARAGCLVRGTEDDKEPILIDWIFVLFKNQPGTVASRPVIEFVVGKQDVVVIYGADKDCVLTPLKGVR